MAFLADPTTKVELNFADQDGKTAVTSIYVDGIVIDPANADVVALADGVEGLSDAKLVGVRCSAGATEQEPAEPTQGDYDHGTDKMKMEYRGADGSTVTLNFPAPQTTNFEVNTTKVDPAAGAIDAWNTWALANLKTAEGTPLTAFRGGFRRQPSRLKRR